MKKYLALAIFLLLTVAACTEPATNNAPATNANSAGKSNVTLSEADAIAREKATWENIKKKDLDGFASLLASDYVEVGGDGIYDKEGIVAHLKDLDLADATFSDWKMLPIDKYALVITYSVTLKGTYKKETIPPGPYRAGAAWVNRDGKWLAVFYQETMAAKPPAGTPAPAAAASPAASTTAVTGPDAVANEKMVWDAIKNKNYDQFAAFLASDFVEIEADGVYDKAGSVKGVSTADLSTAELSDWKSIKLDADAALVTYVVTWPAMKPSAKPSKERHSTAWVNRDGKWIALYHQGTPFDAAAAAAAAKPATSPK